MLYTLQIFLITCILLCTLFAIYYSFKSRKETHPRKRGLFTARTNMFMGGMLIFIALIQLFLYSGSSLRMLFGVIFILLGLFNLVAGIRNHSYFGRMKQ